MRGNSILPIPPEDAPPQYGFQEPQLCCRFHPWYDCAFHQLILREEISMKTTIAIPVLLVSAALVSTAQANWFSDPRTGIRGAFLRDSGPCP